MDPTKRDTLTRLFDSARVDGVAYLLLIVSLRMTTVKELRSITGASEPTINGVLNHLEDRHLVQRSSRGKADHWFPAPAVALAFHQKIFGESSSSSSDLNLIAFNQIRSDPEEEGNTPKVLAQSLALELPEPLPAPRPSAEVERERRIKVYLADRHYHLTGEKRAIYLTDDTITPLAYEAWLYQVAAMKRNGVKIKHPAAYALKCCQKGDAPDPDHLYSAERELDRNLRYFERTDEADEMDAIAGEADAAGATEAEEPIIPDAPLPEPPIPALPPAPRLTVTDWQRLLLAAIARRNQTWYEIYAMTLSVTAVEVGTLCLTVEQSSLDGVRAASQTLLEIAQGISTDIVALRIT